MYLNDNKILRIGVMLHDIYLPKQILKFCIYELIGTELSKVDFHKSIDNIYEIKELNISLINEEKNPPLENGIKLELMVEIYETDLQNAAAIKNKNQTFINGALHIFYGFCNSCPYLNLTEEEQNKYKECHKPEHICEKYNKRVLHKDKYYIKPVNECFRNKDKF